MNTKFYAAPNEEKTHDLDDVSRRSAPKSILIVDDEPDFIEWAKSYLEDLGYMVDTATDGVQGVKRVMTHEYAVILCDMVMPNLAGDMFYTAVERVKPHLCKRFVFMTGFHNDAKVDAFIRKVRGLLLWKPFELHHLVEAIQAVEKKAAPQAS